MRPVTNEDADFVWGSQLPEYSAQQDETPLQRQQKRIHDEQKFELSLTTLATYSPGTNRSDLFNQSHRRYNRLLVSQTGNEPGFKESAIPHSFYQSGRFHPPVECVNREPPCQTDAIDEGRKLKQILLSEAYQPGIRGRPVLGKSTVLGPHEIEPVFVVRSEKNAGTDGFGSRGEGGVIPMEVDEVIVLRNVTEGQPDNYDYVVSKVIIFPSSIWIC